MTSVLDTRSVPPAERREYWSAGIAERFFPMQVESVGAASFEARLAGGQMGPVGVQSIQGLAHRVARTQRMIATADPECILLYLMTKGAIHIEQDDRSCALRPGDIACQDTSRPSTFEGREGFEVLVFSIPKWFIGAQAEGIARRSATLVDSGQGRLTGPAIPFLAQLARTTTSGGGLSGRDGEGAAEMMLPLLRSMYGAQEIADPRSRPEALLARMRRYVMEHLHDPELGPEQSRRPTTCPRATCTRCSPPPAPGCRRGSANAGSRVPWASCAGPRKPRSRPSRRGGDTAIRRASAGPSARSTAVLRAMPGSCR